MTLLDNIYAIFIYFFEQIRIDMFMQSYDIDRALK